MANLETLNTILVVIGAIGIATGVAYILWYGRELWKLHRSQIGNTPDKPDKPSP